MDMDKYFKNTYTVAFRLTGNDIKAGDMAYAAIKQYASDFKLSGLIHMETIQNTAKEVCRMFLADSDNGVKFFRSFEFNTEVGSFQDALMTLNPMTRAAVVWRDVLGYEIDDIAGDLCSKNELYRELNNGRRQMKEILRNTII